MTLKRLQAKPTALPTGIPSELLSEFKCRVLIQMPFFNFCRQHRKSSIIPTGIPTEIRSKSSWLCLLTPLLPPYARDVGTRGAEGGGGKYPPIFLQLSYLTIFQPGSRLCPTTLLHAPHIFKPSNIPECNLSSTASEKCKYSVTASVSRSYVML